jgi:iron complex outermembrane receptor protein
MKSSQIKLMLCASTAMLWTQAALAQTIASQEAAVAAEATTDTAAPSSAAPASDEMAAGDIVVTAQRREQRLQDVPVSVAVTSGEAIQKSGFTDLASLSTRMPSVQIGTGVQSNNIRIRGVGSGLNAGFEQSVGVFVDGVYRPRSRTIQAGLFDVERVEVLNGPQTTFFGNNTIAGAINITSKKPSHEFGYNGQLLYSPSDGQYIAEAGVTGPISETLSARVSGQFSGMDGYIYNRFLGSDGPHLRDFVGRASLRWEPSSNFTSDLRFDYARNRDRSTFNAEIEGCPPPSGYPAARGPCAAYLALRGPNIDNQLDFHADVGPSTFALDFYEGAWNNTIDLGPVSLISLSSYSKSDTDTFIQASPLPVTGVAGYFYQPFRQMETYKLFTQEVRVESQLDGPIQFVVGAYYSHGRLFSDSYASLFNSSAAGAAGAPVTSASTPIGTNRTLWQTDQTRSAFGQVTAELFEGFKLAGGLRYTSVKKDASRRTRAGIGSPTASPDGFTEVDAATQAKLFTFGALSNAGFTNPDTTYNKLMPAVTATYKLNRTVSLYGAYTKGFKAGGYSDSNQPAQFDSENVNAYEVGVKGSILDRRLFFTLDAFYSDFKNLQQAISLIGPTGALITTVGNAASSVSKGIEFTGNLRAADFMTINVSGSYIISKFKDYTSAACTQAQIVATGARCVQDLSGRLTPFAPKFTGNFGFTLTRPVGDRFQLSLEPNLFVSTGYFLAPTNDPLLRQETYALADMRVGFGPEDKSWEFAVIGKNLTDEPVKSSAASAVGTSPGLSYAVLQRARSVAFSFIIRH